MWNLTFWNLFSSTCSFRYLDQININCYWYLDSWYLHDLKSNAKAASNHFSWIKHSAAVTCYHCYSYCCMKNKAEKSAMSWIFIMTHLRKYCPQRPHFPQNQILIFVAKGLTCVDFNLHFTINEYVFSHF